MEKWRQQFRVDPIPVLLASGSDAIAFFARRDLLGEGAGTVEALWELPEAQRILRKQRDDGSWIYGNKKSKTQYPLVDYDQLETFRNLGFLVEKYGFHRGHPAIARAADFLFARQTDEGDFRGIYGTEYVPSYSPAIMELLIKAGYADDPRMEKGFRWLLSMRQDDGGWAAPMRTRGISNTITYWREMQENPGRPPLPTDRSKPFSHMLTGMVLRAFAAHLEHRHAPEAKAAGRLLASRFFKPDKYVDRRGADYWEKVTFPFWFTDIVSALDSLSLLDFAADDEGIGEALGLLKERQGDDGLFALKGLKGGGEIAFRHWICLAVCRAFRRFYD
jgi:hypothetical protein